MSPNALHLGHHKGFSQMYFWPIGKNLGKVPIGWEFYSRESFMLPDIQNVGQGVQFPDTLNIP